MCDCNNTNNNKTNNCNCEKDYCGDLEDKKKCEFNYLKPLCIDKLFGSDDCTKFSTTLEKSKRVRNAFFAAKTSIFNFVEDCDTIADSLQSDLSDNEIELENVKNQYLSVLNNVSASLYTSLRQVYNGRLLINVDLAKVDETNEEAQRPQKSTELKFTHPNNCNSSILSYIPGVTIQMNRVNKLVKVKLSEPEFISGLNRHGSAKKEKDVTKTYVLAPSIFSVTSFEQWDENDEINSFSHDNIFGKFNIDLGNDDDVFSNLDICRDFFEEIVNYQDNYVIDEDSSYGNQILEIINYFDKVIMSMEHSHKFVVQMSRINDDLE